MKLLSFRIQNYRSISDSGEIAASRITALLGRNESGKTNLLRALASLNPPEGMAELSKIKDFPRGRRLSECKPETPVVDTGWELNDREWAELQAIWPRAKAGETVRVGRRYSKRSWVEISSEPLNFDPTNISTILKKTALAAKAAAAKLEDEPKAALEAVANTFAKNAEPGSDAKVWATAMKQAGDTLGVALATADTKITEKQEEAFSGLTNLAEEILNDEAARDAATEWVVQQIPTFVYLADYPEIEGHQNVSEYLARHSGPSFSSLPQLSRGLISCTPGFGAKELITATQARRRKKARTSIGSSATASSKTNAPRRVGLRRTSNS